MDKRTAFKLNARLVKIMEEFCNSREIDIKDFIEEAIIEKLETEEIKNEIAVYDKPYEEYNLNQARADVRIAEPKKGKMH